MGQEKQLASCLRGSKNALGFGNLTQLAMVVFHRVGIIDQAPDLSRIGKEGRQLAL